MSFVRPTVVEINMENSYHVYDFGEMSDEDRAESSEDEIDIILHGTPEQRRRHIRNHQIQRGEVKNGGDTMSSSEDEFEKEMNAELDKTVKTLETDRGTKQNREMIANAATSSNVPLTMTDSCKETFYDDIYFDSDEESNYEEDSGCRVRKRHVKPSDDDLLYDPDMDDRDQQWVNEQLRRHRGIRDVDYGTASTKPKKLSAPSSDAVLDCPACMTTLCLDCQRHEFYIHQYRAMFVMNCKVDKSEILRVPEQAANKKWKKSKKNVTQSSSNGDGDSTLPSTDKFHPVKCEECDTVVGVMDMDEVYHFFNVLVSQS